MKDLASFWNFYRMNFSGLNCSLVFPRTFFHSPSCLLYHSSESIFRQDLRLNTANEASHLDLFCSHWIDLRRPIFIKTIIVGLKLPLISIYPNLSVLPRMVESTGWIFMWHFGICQMTFSIFLKISFNKTFVLIGVQHRS